MSRHYDSFDAEFSSPIGHKIVSFDEHNIRPVRQKVRVMLDKDNLDYATLKGYRNGQCVVITGVRSSRKKHFPVVTATRG